MIGKGDTFQHTFRVTPDVYNGFISIFNDHNILHTNEAYAQEKGFKSKVMHGNILGGFISYFIGECLPMDNVIIQTQEIRYYNPFYEGDELLLTAKVLDVYESVNTSEISYVFENTAGTKIAKGKVQIGII